MKEILLISGLGIAVLLLEILKWQKAILPVIIAGLLAIIGVSVMHFQEPENLYNMLFIDKTARLLMILLSVIAIFWFIQSREYLANISHISDYSSLIIFSMVGAFILTSYINMTMLFLGVEILSIPVYVLAGSDKRNLASNEAAFKYFLMGAFASSFLLLGIALLYGATGTFDIRFMTVAIKTGLPVELHLLILGLLLVLFALAFKVSAVPFHFWAPDVYMGAPTPVTAYMATIVKISALAAFFQLFGSMLNVFHIVYASIALVIAVLTVMMGNLLAVSQDNVKRMLAYSGIGHAGFVLLGIAMQQHIDPSFIIYYLAAYSISGIAAFWVLIKISAEGQDVGSFNGLVKRNPLLAGTMTLALLSMAGIPPLSGFFAKYFILINVIVVSPWVAVVAIIASVIGVYYYFRVIIAMFSGQAANENKIELDMLSTLSLVLLCILIIALGVYPEFVFSLLK